MIVLGARRNLFYSLQLNAALSCPIKTTEVEKSLIAVSRRAQFQIVFFTLAWWLHPININANSCPFHQNVMDDDWLIENCGLPTSFRGTRSQKRKREKPSLLDWPIRIDYSFRWRKCSRRLDYSRSLKNQNNNSYQHFEMNQLRRCVFKCNSEQSLALIWKLICAFGDFLEENPSSIQSIDRQQRRHLTRCFCTRRTHFLNCSIRLKIAWTILGVSRLPHSSISSSISVISRRF